MTLPAQNQPKTGMPRLTAWAFLLCTLLATLMFPAGTSAHARFASASIDPGAILVEVPASITLTFTESIDPVFSSASLIAPDQSIVSSVSIVAGNDDSSAADFVIMEAGNLPAGSYALVWRVVSSVDGHTTTGVLSFSAGTGAAPEIASTSEASGGNWSGTVGRFLELAGLLSMAGASLFAIICGDPTRSLRRITAVALPVAIVGLLVALLNLFGNATGQGFGTLPAGSRAVDILTDSSPGRALLFRFSALLVIVLLLVPQGRRVATVATALAAGVALASFSFVGHAAGLRGNIAIAFDLIHIMSSAIWVGGLLLVALSLWRSRHSANDLLVPLVSGFSRIALVVFTAIGATGLTGAWFNVAGPQNLTGTDYGLAVIMKAVVALLILTAAAVNYFLVLPKLRAAPASDRLQWWRSLRLSASIELGLAIVVVLVAARLTSIPPADEPLTVDVAARSGAVQIDGVSGDLAIAFTGPLVHEPAGVFRIVVTDEASGAPVTNIARLIIDARAPDPLDAEAEPIQDRFDAAPIAGMPGLFELPRSRLGLEEIWSIEIIVRRIGLIDEALAFELDLTATAPQPPRLVEEVWRLPRIAWSGYLAIAAAAVTAVGSLLLIRRLKGLEPATAGIMLAVAAIIAIGFLLSAWRSGPIPVTDAAFTAPPFPDDPGAIQHAADTWAMQCAACHGVDGGGIGEESENQNHAHPSVAGDLLGSQSRARTPGEIYWIITNGLGGTTMPAFDLALSDQERAELVAYLEDLQDRAPQP